METRISPRGMGPGVTVPKTKHTSHKRRRANDLKTEAHFLKSERDQTTSIRLNFLFLYIVSYSLFDLHGVRPHVHPGIRSGVTKPKIKQLSL